jgi:Flp pilus assembly protein TadD
VVIIVLGTLAYINSFSGAFVFDDFEIANNVAVRQLWPPWQAMFAPQNISRPLIGLSLAINYAISGLDVWSYHALNLAVHLLAALALFGIVRRTLLSEPLRERFGRHSFGLALVTAVIWMIHPLQTQSMTYVIQRCESIMGLFYLVSFYCAVRSYDWRRKGWWYAAAIAASAAGMLSKQVMVTAPLLILLHDSLFLSGSIQNALRTRWALYLGLASTWGVLIATTIASPLNPTAGFAVHAITPLNYFVSEFGVVVHYLRLSLWPDTLVIDYGWPQATSAGEILPYAAVLLVLAGATCWSLIRRRPDGFLGAWFFVVLSVTSSVMPFEDLAFEHRMYLPLAAVVAFVVIGGFALVNRVVSRFCSTEHRRTELVRLVSMSLVAIMVGSLISLTLKRNVDYQSQMAIWSDVVNKRPDNWRGHSNLGFWLMENDNREAAGEQFAEALRLKPGAKDALENMGMWLLGSDKSADALPYFQQLQEADPDRKKLHFHLGRALESQGRIDEAVHEYNEELKQEPKSAETRMQLAWALERQKEYAEAAAAYRETLAVAPEWPQPLCRYALLLADAEAGQVRNASEAIRLAEKAVHVAGRQPITLDVLASVYSSTGRFEDAIAVAKEAIDMAKLGGADELAGAIGGRLQMYKQGRAARP